MIRKPAHEIKHLNFWWANHRLFDSRLMLYWGHQLDHGRNLVPGISVMATHRQWFGCKSLGDTVGVVGRLDVPRLRLPNNKPWLWICKWEIWWISHWFRHSLNYLKLTIHQDSWLVELIDNHLSSNFPFHKDQSVNQQNNKY